MPIEKEHQTRFWPIKNCFMGNFPLENPRHFLLDPNVKPDQDEWAFNTRIFWFGMGSPGETLPQKTIHQTNGMNLPTWISWICDGKWLFLNMPVPWDASLGSAILPPKWLNLHFFFSLMILDESCFFTQNTLSRISYRFDALDNICTSCETYWNVANFFSDKFAILFRSETELRVLSEVAHWCWSQEAQWWADASTQLLVVGQKTAIRKSLIQ